MPGRRYALTEALLDDTPPELVVVEVRHDGDAARPLEFYRNESLSTEASVAHRMRLPTRRPAQLETATVVGPAGTELHTDGHGRVQVRFHWDLESEAPSAWVRVAQSWSGAGFGANFLPRVGTEVLVGYVGGDPDRPIVLGALHHALSPPAFGYGAEAERSGIRTRSTPGGVGYHELVFDDRAGRERVGLRSQRDLSVQAHGDTAVEVGGQHSAVIGGSSSTTIAGAATSLVGGARVDDTGGDRSAQVGANDRVVITGDASTTIGGSSTVQVLGLAATTQLAGSRHTFVGVGPAGGAEIVACTGDIQQNAGRNLELNAKDSLQLRCGRSTIRMTPDGIFLEADRIETHAVTSSRVLHGEDRSQVWASDGGFTVSAAIIKLASEGASLVLDSEAKLDGALVKLNCGPSSAGGAGEGVVNDSGEAVFHLDPSSVPAGSGPYTFFILDPQGEVLSRELMPGGEVRLQGKPGQRFVLEQVRLGNRVLPFRRSHT
jgi:type VI secretion system secreted protein VgrG